MPTACMGFKKQLDKVIGKDHPELLCTKMLPPAQGVSRLYRMSEAGNIPVSLSPPNHFPTHCQSPLEMGY